MQPFPQAFFDRNAALLARDLLGTILIRETREGRTSGRVVETEAYLSSQDPACHAHKGLTRKNASMFGPPGIAYVYAIHAKWCFNVVSEREGLASAVLIRALEPLEGTELMAARRGTEKPLDWTRGPGRLCQALAIDRSLDKWPLTLGTQLWLTAAEGPPIQDEQVAIAPRIGVTSGEDLLLRFFLNGSRWVSGPRKYHTAPRH